jgi:hypothetical protein
MDRHKLSSADFDALKSKGFSKVSEIQLSQMPGRLKFSPEVLPDDRLGWVYLWVAERGDTVEICYVGKAGHSLKKRFDQHAGGFKHSTTGRQHAQKLTELLERGQPVTVYARHSDYEKRFDQTVSMCCVDELALIARFNPPWNKIDSRSKSREAVL